MNANADPAFRRIPELIHEHALARPHQRALVQGDEAIDYAGLDALMDRVAAALQRDGCRPGDAIAIPPGAVHTIRNTGDTTLKFLCCCAPGYEHDDTVLQDPSYWGRY